MKDRRGFELETYCVVDLDAFRENIANILRWVEKRAVILAVKANAYGHGVVPICREARSAGIEHFGVATVDEGVQIRQAGIEGEIIVLTPATLEQIETIVEFDLHPNVVSQTFAHALSVEAERQGKKAACHIEIDTGMGRTGFWFSDAIGEIAHISQLPFVEIAGIFSHFPVADSTRKSDIDFTKLQLRRFSVIAEKLKELGISPPLIHLSNSAGILSHPVYGNGIRPGILAYGLYPSAETASTVKVKPALSLYSRVIQVRDYPPGTSISYGRTYTTRGRERIAVFRAGYGDGLRRALSNRGFVLIRGKRFPIVGRVCMDMTMADVTGSEVELDDIVVILGEDNGGRITAEDHAIWAGTLNYEILTGLSERVKRLYKKNGEICEAADLS
ncbi:MAG TPA: alanine racemase [candidate division Zixibacteria bacterium]|nr:alanine racemase [candidate division Zixibacteria bacterium]